MAATTGAGGDPRDDAGATAASGRAEEDDARAVRRHGSLVLALVAALVVGALLAGLVAGFRVTGVVLGLGLVALAVVRVAGSSRLVGPLAVRSRAVDTVVALVLAVGLLGLSVTTPGAVPGPVP
ncbi:DUF3017 domain-containing protein [Pseudokineococcus basanitobsidens]|uniref:DUF3017 domain-containing protein n=1 Tax=Pseudokineococcus basanitobsidens TaxID=1926649 RepID=A0ABU8RHF4_9ACTN